VGLRLASRLSKAAAAAGDELLWRVAREIERCCEPENIWIGYGLRDASQRVFDGTAALWSCGHLMCPNCHPKDARRLRKRARAVLEGMPLLVGEQFRFITLTLPTARDVGLFRSYEIFREAWELFRKREFWMTRLGGGVFRIEWEPNDVGFHVHAHLVVASKWIEIDECKQEWKACVVAAWKKCDVSQEIVTRSGLPFVNVKLTYNRKDRKWSENVRDAVCEGIKYVCKMTNWSELSDADLLRVGRALLEGDKMPRSFEVVGRLNRRHTIHQNRDTARRVPLLVQRNASDGEILPYLRDGFDWSPSSFGGSEAALMARAMALGRRVAMRKLPTWLWIAVSDVKIAESRSRRREGLSGRYAQAVFETLAGDRWRGVM
jgi:hypothetical protein